MMSSTGRTGKHTTLYLRLAALAVAALFVPAFILTGCLPDGARGGVSTEIVEAKIGDQVYYIPKAYLNFQHTSVGPDGFLLQAYYPGSAIVPGDVKELWKQGVWWKNISILGHARESAISFHEFSQKSTAYLKATKLVGNEYGLVHYKQPEGEVQEQYDVWLEIKETRTVSYLTCSEKVREIDNVVPQCSHIFYFQPNLWLKVDYDRKLLPEWKNIEQEVQKMFASFKSRDLAEKFIQRKSFELKVGPLQEVKL